MVQACDATAASSSEQKPLCCRRGWERERSSVPQAALHKKEGGLKGCAVGLKSVWKRRSVRVTLWLCSFFICGCGGGWNPLRVVGCLFSKYLFFLRQIIVLSCPHVAFEARLTALHTEGDVAVCALDNYGNKMLYNRWKKGRFRSIRALPQNTQTHRRNCPAALLFTSVDANKTNSHTHTHTLFASCHYTNCHHPVSICRKPVVQELRFCLFAWQFRALL